MPTQSVVPKHTGGVRSSTGAHMPLRDEAQQVDVLDLHAEVNLDWGMDEPLQVDLLADFMKTDDYLTPDFHLDGRRMEDAKLMACATAAQAWFSLEKFTNIATKW